MSSNPAIDPAKLAKIRAQQDYQRAMDTHKVKEEKRLKLNRQYRVQALVMPFVIALLWFISAYLPRMEEYTYSSGIIVVFGVLVFSEIAFILMYLTTLRPSPMPKAPEETN